MKVITHNAASGAAWSQQRQDAALLGSVGCIATFVVVAILTIARAMPPIIGGILMAAALAGILWFGHLHASIMKNRPHHGSAFLTRYCWHSVAADAIKCGCGAVNVFSSTGVAYHNEIDPNGGREILACHRCGQLHSKYLAPKGKGLS